MTSKQFYLCFAIFVISLKVQKMPALVYGFLENNSFVLFLAFAIIDLFLICLAFWVSQSLKRQNFLLKPPNKTLELGVKIGLIIMSVYFLMQGSLFYEAIQDLFSHVLFDNITWWLFSLLLVFCVFFMARCGLTNIARNIELYIFVIVISYIMLSIFGALETDFSVVFPLENIRFNSLKQAIIPFNIWFGDFIIMFFLGLNAGKIRLKNTILTYLISMAVVVLFVVEFNGIFLSYSANQPSVISVISEQTMLGIDIGRIDWFFIIITQVGTVFCAGICLYFSKYTFSKVFPKLNSNAVLTVFMILLYVADIFVFVDTNAKAQIFLGGFAQFIFVFKFIATAFVLVSTLFYRNQKEQKA